MNPFGEEDEINEEITNDDSIYNNENKAKKVIRMIENINLLNIYLDNINKAFIANTPEGTQFVNNYNDPIQKLYHNLRIVLFNNQAHLANINNELIKNNQGTVGGILNFKYNTLKGGRKRRKTKKTFLKKARKTSFRR